MKHSAKIVALLLLMFFITQIIGIAVSSVYLSNNYDVPYGLNPPQDVNPAESLFSIIFAIAFAVLLMMLLIKFKTEMILRLWFFFVVTIAIGITINALFLAISLPSLNPDFRLFSINLPALLALIIAAPLAFIKIFNRNISVHNFTEMLVYPGIAVIFVPLLSLWTTILLLILISVYDIYAVWHTGLMQKMAKYQINNLKIFSGFFIPYLGKKEKAMIRELAEKDLKSKKIKVNLAILGGGDVVFPIILAGVVLKSAGLFSALMVSVGASLALLYLFYISKRGKFYPAMPFISIGCLIGLSASSLF